MRWISDHISLSRRNSLRAGYDIVQSRGKVLPFEEVNLSALCSTPRTINNLSLETGPLPRIKGLVDDADCERAFGSRGAVGGEQTPPSNAHSSAASSVERIKKIFMFFEPKGCLKERDDYSLYLFPQNNRFRVLCRLFVEQKWFDNVVLLFIGLNCITLAMERPNIPPDSRERIFLSTANYIFTVVFAVEMFVKVRITSFRRFSFFFKRVCFIGGSYRYRSSRPECSTARRRILLPDGTSWTVLSSSYPLLTCPCPSCPPVVRGYLEY